MHRGYIKLWRKTFDNPFLRRPIALALWVHLLLSANHKDRDELLGGKRITCRPGQFTTGRKQLSDETGIPQTTVERILTRLESEHQIGQRKTSINRLITICNWNIYQQDGQRYGQQMDSDRTATGQRVDTPKECKNVNTEEEKQKIPAESAADFEQPVENHKQVDLKDIEISGQTESVKHKIYNQVLALFQERGWRTDPEYLKTVFRNIVAEMDGYNPKEFFPYFKKVAFNHINRNAETYAADARIKRGQEKKIGLTVAGVSI